jgi:hypothetical protein
MMKYAILLVSILAVSAAACQKKEEAAAPADATATANTPAADAAKPAAKK